MLTEVLPVHAKQPSLFSSDDRVFLGEGVFETLKVEQQQPCYAFYHWRRMSLAATRIGIPFDVSYEQWHHHLVLCIESSSIQTGGIKVLLSGGQAPRGLHARGEPSRLLFEAFLYSPVETAINLVSAGWLRDAKNPIYHLKSVNYLEAILARREAIERGADEVLFFNLDHYATETAVANLFIVHGDTLYTPKLDNGVLAGVIRSRLLTLCLGKGIMCSETSITSDMILQSDAVFVSNSLREIQWVQSFDGVLLPVEHRLINSLQTLLSNDVERFIDPVVSV